MEKLINKYAEVARKNLQGSKVLERIGSGKFEYINNHNGREEKLDGIIIFDGYVCPLYYGAFCLNPLYIGTDDKLHLSEASVGGTLVFEKDDEQIIAECVEYNYRPFGRGTIEHVFVVTDGSLRGLPYYFGK